MRIALATCFIVGLAVCAGADWPQFRGPDGQSYSAQTDLPTGEQIADSIAWKKETPGRAVSGPIVVGDKVVVTASGGPRDERLFAIAFDAESGAELWRREFWATGRTLHHPTSATAAPTPASDSEAIYAFYSSNDLVCLDLDGNLRWLRGLTADHPAAYNDTGMAASPVVVGDTVIVQVECYGDSFAAGIDKHNGETRWRVERPAAANWTSPIAWRGPSGDAVLLQSSDRLTAHDAATGKELWSYSEACSGIPSATPAGDVIYVPSAGLTALQPVAEAAPQVLWKQNRLDPSAASPLVVGDRTYVINGAGVLVAAETKDGDIKWQTRLSGTFWATPVIAGEHLYAVNQDGLLLVVKLPGGDDKGEVTGRHELGEPVFGSPAIGDAALFVRGEMSLWKFAKK